MGLVCLLAGMAAGTLAFLIEDQVLQLVAVLVGLPMALVGLVLIFRGLGGRRLGLLSPPTLYVLAGVSAVLGVAGLLAGERSAFGGLMLAFGCGALARRRARQPRARWR